MAASRGQKRANVCRYFATTGSCYYGDRCQFQHVRTNLTQPARPAEASSATRSVSVSEGGKQPQGTPFQYGMSTYHPSSHPHIHTSGRGRGATTLPVLPSKQVQTSRQPSLSNTPPLHPRLRTHKIPAAQAQVDARGTTYFYSADQEPTYMPEYTMYTQPPTHIAQNKKPGLLSPLDLRQELLHRQTMCLSRPAENTCPTEVDSYHSLCPLEPLAPHDKESSKTFGHASTCYRAINSKDGLYYCLRRVHGFRLTSGKAVVELEKWRKLQHTNLVSLREMFTTRAFGDNSLVFVYDYHAGAESMHRRHLQQGRRAGPLPEELVWEYVIQLVSALRLVHGAGLALRCVHSSKALVTGRQSPRVHLNGGGIMDILMFDGSESATPTLRQQQDLLALGELLVGVALQTPTATLPEHFHQSMDTLATHYSPDVHHIVQYLLQSGSKGPPHSIVDVLPMIGGRVYHSLERCHLHQDLVEGELGRELENGRLFRLLAKLGIITERPEFAGDTQWSETGDRYLLKLLRDYLFHQVLPSGAPWMDLAHIIQTLNKLDAGIPESLSLHSRDEQSVLVVSYSDLKACLESAFAEVLTAAQKASSK